MSYRRSCIAAWGSAVAAIVLWASDYTATPGAASDPPPQWPVGSVLDRRADRPTLLIFLHPACPCSRASLAELEVLLSTIDSPVTATAVFEKTDFDVRDTPFWRAASNVRGLKLIADDGTERARFDARTSGEAMLYDAEGRLTFRGGVTAGRGHRGENAGRLTLAALLNGESIPVAAPSNLSAGRQCPVYGCPLIDHRAAAPARSEARQ